MANDSSENRVEKYRNREKKMGMQRLDVSLHSTTYDMLLELVEKAGYDVDKKEKGKGVNGVLTQLIYEIYHRTAKVQLDRKRQQGFLLAQKLKMLKADGVKPKSAKQYVEKENPSDYLDTEDSEWSIQTLNQLIEEYGDAFGPEELPSKEEPKETKKAPVRKNTPSTEEGSSSEEVSTLVKRLHWKTENGLMNTVTHFDRFVYVRPPVGCCVSEPVGGMSMSTVSDGDSDNVRLSLALRINAGR